MNKINPNLITGLVDAEGCFYVRIAESKKYKTGWWIQPCFQIGFHVRDLYLLLQIKSFFGEAGSIYPINKGKAVLYQVRNLNDITRVILPHFDKYPLITQKYSDFILFKNIVELMNNGEQFKKDSIFKFINLKASLNRGLSNKLSLSFPDVIKVDRSLANIPTCLDYNWLAGFFTGEGCFSVSIPKLTHSKADSYPFVRLRVTIAQRSIDKELMYSIANTINCGTLSDNKGIVLLTVSSFKEVYDKIIPLFKEYSIKGIKAIDFKDFCIVADLVNKKNHLTLTGSEQISIIKSKMNKGRYI